MRVRWWMACQDVGRAAILLFLFTVFAFHWRRILIEVLRGCVLVFVKKVDPSKVMVCRSSVSGPPWSTCRLSFLSSDLPMF